MGITTLTLLEAMGLRTVSSAGWLTQATELVATQPSLAARFLRLALRMCSSTLSLGARKSPVSPTKTSSRSGIVCSLLLMVLSLPLSVFNTYGSLLSCSNLGELSFGLSCQ